MPAAARVLVPEVYPHAPRGLEHPHHLLGGGDERVQECLGRFLGANLPSVVTATVPVGAQRVVRRRGNNQVNGAVGQGELLGVCLEDQTTALSHAALAGGCVRVSVS